MYVGENCVDQTCLNKFSHYNDILPSYYNNFNGLILPMIFIVSLSLNCMQLKVFSKLNFFSNIFCKNPRNKT